jgi:hypothetical protein
MVLDRHFVTALILKLEIVVLLQYVLLHFQRLLSVFPLKEQYHMKYLFVPLNKQNIKIIAQEIVINRIFSFTKLQ